jgi:hypothetical protein
MVEQFPAERLSATDGAFGKAQPRGSLPRGCAQDLQRHGTGIGAVQR